ncbi:MAG: hypothetical protein L0K86_08245 [Actinomycetia bacterium]|nr:hypothetical protein [Actinomycetes bacterium]
MHPSSTLTDPAYRVPEPEPGTQGMGWLRSHIARFSEGTEHIRRRDLVVGLLAGLEVEPEVGEDPTACLVRALGLPQSFIDAVETIAAAYHPHLPTTPEADAAVERFVAQFGDRNETVAATISLLVQAHAGTHALIDVLRDGADRAPVPATRRVAPDGIVVEVDLTDAHFGRGAHACPGEALGRRLAEAATS